jgi:hypothetical protein
MNNIIFSFEQKYFDDKYISSNLEWMNKYWNLSILYTLIYISAIYYGQKFFKYRYRYELKYPLFIWNMLLSTFSIMGTIRLLPIFINKLSTDGLYGSICDLDHVYGISGCWGWLFVLSKALELFDTFFIIVRKQKLIFLHWFHHITVLIYSWYSTHEVISTSRWFIMINYIIHAIMYGYYALRALKFNINKKIIKSITILQTSQMVIGILVNLLDFYYKTNNTCNVSYSNIFVSLLMYLSYFILFLMYFKKTY